MKKHILCGAFLIGTVFIANIVAKEAKERFRKETICEFSDKLKKRVEEGSNEDIFSENPNDASYSLGVEQRNSEILDIIAEETCVATM